MVCRGRVLDRCETRLWAGCCFDYHFLDSDFLRCFEGSLYPCAYRRSFCKALALSCHFGFGFGFGSGSGFDFGTVSGSGFGFHSPS
jgi:hypothetical protein